MNKSGHICVLDSGIGGVTVLAELLKLMPNESYIYFGDLKNAPYGEKSTEEVRTITLKNIDTLIKKGAKTVVVACNTATGAAVKEARERYTALPIIGIEPAIKPAVTAFEGKKILIMATPLTLKQEKFNILYNKWNATALTELLPCPGLAKLIEDGHINDREIKSYLTDLFSKVNTEDTAAIVLGCTHYPIIKNEIKKIFPSATIFDGGEGTARHTKNLLESMNLSRDSSSEKIEVHTSLNEEKTKEFKANVINLLSTIIK